MNWEAAGAIGEIVGAAGVIATLIYLAVQLKQSTVTNRANVRSDVASLGQNLSLYLAERPELFEKIMAEDEVSAHDEIQISLYIRAFIRSWETYCYMHDVGLLDDEEWGVLQKTLERIVPAPGFRNAYKDMSEEVTPRLRALIEPILGNAEST